MLGGQGISGSAELKRLVLLNAGDILLEGWDLRYDGSGCFILPRWLYVGFFVSSAHECEMR